MRLTIDSTEPLDRVLSVLSATYGVTITEATEAVPTPEPVVVAAVKAPRKARAAKAAPAPAPAPAKVAAEPAPRKASRRSRPAAAAAAASAAAETIVADAKTIRDWALAAGHEVSRRGSLPKAVRDAYHAANGG